MKTMIVILLAVLALVACTDESNAPDDADGTADAPLGISVGISGGRIAASCVEAYDLNTVTNRSFAFDGTVVSVGGQEGGSRNDALGLYVDVIFDVHEWFRGGDGGRVTVQMMAPGVVTSAENAAYDVGSRLLVAGEPRWGGEPLDDAIAWACGFTQTHDAETAAAWRDAFASAGG